jgi:hypothetical protein
VVKGKEIYGDVRLSGRSHPERSRSSGERGISLGACPAEPQSTLFFYSLHHQRILKIFTDNPDEI